MKKAVFLMVLCTSSWAFSQDKTDESRQLRSALLQKTGIFFAKGDTISQDAYLSALKVIQGSDEDLGLKDAIVTIGERYVFKTDLYVGPHGPEYAIDNLLAVSMDIEIDGSKDASSISKFLSGLPIDDAIAKFIKAGFLGSDKYSAEYGKDFYLASVMATMMRYPGYKKTLETCAMALERKPDARVVPFLRSYLTMIDRDPETAKTLEDLLSKLIDRTVKKEIFGRPYDCESLPKIARDITRSSEKKDVEAYLKDLSRLTCKEAVSYIFMINNISYINKGDNLFGNEDYFRWDTDNLRYSFDLKTKGQFEEEIDSSYRCIQARMGITFTEALKLLAERYDRIFIGSDSIYFEYLFRIPFDPSWELNKKELFNLVNNVIFADAGYELVRSGNIYKLSKAR